MSDIMLKKIRKKYFMKKFMKNFEKELRQIFVKKFKVFFRQNVFTY